MLSIGSGLTVAPLRALRPRIGACSNWALSRSPLASCAGPGPRHLPRTATLFPPTLSAAFASLSPSLATAAPVPSTQGSPQQKRQRSMATPVTPGEASVPLRVGTHNGTFHCDEALGCFMIRMTDRFKDAEVIRTRDQQVLDTLDAVLDVGGVYDPQRCRFDHHQRGFDHSFGHGFTTKLSSAGLVYKHFGREVIAKLMGLQQDSKDVETVFLAVYKSFMEAVDAMDNGVNQYATDTPPLYQSHTHLGARVGRLYPDWTEEHTREKEDAQFRKAMALAGEEFVEAVNYTARSWLPARAIVAESLADAPRVHSSGEIVVLKSFCPWKDHLAELEVELKIPLDRLPKYMLYQDERAQQWRIQAVSVAPGSFQSRLPLPEAWRGLRDEELSRGSGIPGCVFVHISGFIGGNLTFEGALQMATKALVGACTSST